MVRQGGFVMGLGARVVTAAVAVALMVAGPAVAAEPQVDHVRVAVSDGVRLDGWIVRPPGDRRVPVVLWSGPYFGQCNLKIAVTAPGEEPECRYGTGDDRDLWDNSNASEAV